MEEITVRTEDLSVKETLECGQVFRYFKSGKGYTVISLNKCAYLYEENGFTHILSNDINYFYNYFDLGRDYSKIKQDIKSFNIEYLDKSVEASKGLRLLRQDPVETAFSFIISQNNNIKRIQNSINKICENCGEKLEFLNETYYAFPSVETLADKSVEFYKSLGLGYRNEYILRFAKLLSGGFDFNSLCNFSTPQIEKELLKIHGIGKKVADCITLFGFYKYDSFPVDTWIEKLYLENLGGTEKDRKKISEELVSKFKELSGFVQQYLFYYKRSLSK